MENRNKLYIEYVNEARQLVDDIENNKKQVARLALEVCDIQMGGHKGAGLYSMAKFASDIGVNRKTLSAWVQLIKIEEVAEVDIPDGKQHVIIEKMRQAGKVREIIKDKGKTKSIVRQVLIEEDDEEFFRKMHDVCSRLNYLVLEYDISAMDKDRMNQVRHAIGRAYERLNV